MIYKKGTKFTVCDHDEMKKKGWKLSRGWAISNYIHSDFDSVTWKMIEDYQGQTLTVIRASINFLNLYYVKENAYLWPVKIFLGK